MKEKAADGPGPRAVKVEKARPRVLRETITTAGTAAAVKRSHLNFQVPGVVSEVLVDMGERVGSGQPLARLDDTGYKLRLDQAQASFDAASASLSKLKTGFRPEEIAQAQAGVEAAQAALEKFTGGFRSEEIKAAEAGLAAAQAGYEQAERDFERMKKLFEEKKAVAAATFEQARTRHEVARAQRDQARERLSSLRSGYEQADVESMRARFKQAAEQLALLKKGFREEDVSAAEAQVALARATLKIAQKALRDTVLRAPYDGIVVRTYVHPGDAGGSGIPGQVAVEFMDISSLEIVVPVPDIHAADVSEKSSAVVNLDGGPKGLKAGVKAISCAIDPASRAFSVKLQIPNPGLKLKAGMFARVSIIYSEITALAVRSSAVMGDGNGEYVMVYDDGFAVRVPVETGISSDGYTQITKNLAEGRPVIHDGNFGLPDGARVELSGDGQK